MSNITEKSKYSFVVEFEYPDPYSTMTMQTMRYTMHAEVVETNLADACDAMMEQWRRKYDPTNIKGAKITLEITPVEEETLPPAA